MCGIAGIIGDAARDERLLRAMGKRIAHRGPDDSGIWIDSEAGVGFAHRRLAIVDLSPAGHQPMLSADGRFVLNYNGEIYNHRELRAELDGNGPRNWRGDSDTETLVECIAEWGLERALRACVGMFALALWDRAERRLSLARDRFGEKPLYYGWAGTDLVFASELKALRLHPKFEPRVSRDALRLYASRGYVPAPLSIYERVFKLPPASILSFTLDVARSPRNAAAAHEPASGVTLTHYWSYADVVARGLDQPIEDEAEALEQLHEALAAAIRGQSIADVPVGAFLSGGIDSSTVVALYQKYSATPVRSFTIGIADAALDEAGHAREVAAALGTVHNEQYVTVDQARGVIPLLPAMYDEPFADASQIPTFLVSRFARGEVKVALSGDGGDELFGGYNRHIAAPAIWRRVRRLPRPVRAAAAAAIGLVPDRLFDRAMRMLSRDQAPQLGGKLRKGLRVAAGARSFDDLCLGLLDEWSLADNPAGHRAGIARGGLGGPAAADAVRLMYHDAVSYLPDDILCKVDRASMAASLEARAPFLDHRVAEVAARIPLAMKIRGGRGKSILRRLLACELPPALFERPKRGFAIPVGEWIRGPLRPWAEELLDPAALAREGWFDPGVVEQRWRRHLAGAEDSTAAIWSILMFQAWLREQGQALPAGA
jgi:asparagine synthase (glutamine-hydrolysing)